MILPKHMGRIKKALNFVKMEQIDGCLVFLYHTHHICMKYIDVICNLSNGVGYYVFFYQSMNIEYVLNTTHIQICIEFESNEIDKSNRSTKQTIKRLLSRISTFPFD